MDTPLGAALSGGTAAAPSGATILGALAADAAAVLLAFRSVGHVAWRYGYDPEEPAEKLFFDGAGRL